MAFDQVTVVVLAGDPKCLDMIPGSDETYLDRALTAISALNCSNVVIVAHQQVIDGFRSQCGVRLVRGGSSLIESLEFAFAVVQTDLVLCVSSDLAHIDKDSLKDFLQRSMDMRADVCVPVALCADCLRPPYNSSCGHRVRVDGQLWKCGSVFSVKRSVSKLVLSEIRFIVGMRKKPVKLIVHFLFRHRLFSLAIRYLISVIFGFNLINFWDIQLELWHKIGIKCSALKVLPNLVIDHD